MEIRRSFFTVIALCSAVFLAGCATKIVEKPSPVTPTTTKLSQFSKVILVKSEIAPNYAKDGANAKASSKIDEVLRNKLSSSFPSVETVSKAPAASPSNDHAVIIKPYIKQIKFIGGAARFWAGAMAGSSVVIMDVAFIDAQTGKQLSNPGFERSAGAYTDAFGVASNKMLEDVANDAANYASANK